MEYQLARIDSAPFPGVHTLATLRVFIHNEKTVMSDVYVHTAICQERVS
jgi:hypothetical protein